MKLKLHERFIIDDSGKRREVIMPISAYKKLLELLEDLEDVQYIKKHKDDEEITLDEFVSQLKEEKLV
jgi:hypothetical protein